MPYDLQTVFGTRHGQLTPEEMRASVLRQAVGGADNAAAVADAKNAGDLTQDPFFANAHAQDDAAAMKAGTPTTGTMPQLKDGDYGTASYFQKRMMGDQDVALGEQKVQQGQIDLNTNRAKAGASGVPLPAQPQGRGFVEGGARGGRTDYQEDGAAPAVQPADLDNDQYRALLGGGDPAEVAKLPAQVQMTELEAGAKKREGELGKSAAGMALYQAAAPQVQKELGALKAFIASNDWSIAGNMDELDQKVQQVRQRLNALDPSRGARDQIELDIKQTLQDALDSFWVKTYGDQGVRQRYGLVGAQPGA